MRMIIMTTIMTMSEWAADNEHIGEIAAVSPRKWQCDFGSYYPARTFVKPLPRQYATTLHASGGQRSDNDRKNIESNVKENY